MGKATFYAMSHAAVHQRERRLRLAEDGLCVICGVVSREQGRTRCRPCADYWNARTRKPYRGRWETQHPEWRALSRKKQLVAAWAQVVAGYGGSCQCCGLAEVIFLTLDHAVPGEGKADRKRRSQLGFYRSLIREGFPARIVLLCWNCHMSKDMRGGCPHRGVPGVRVASWVKPLETAPASNSQAAYLREWQRLHRDRTATYRRRYTQRLLARVLAGYGDCKCCGQAEAAFLTLDHVNGGGGAARRNSRSASGVTLYVALLREGFPDRFQVLCWNCHMAKDRKGGCPHGTLP